LELAQQLKAQGREVPLLVVLDAQGPLYRHPVTLRSMVLGARDVKDRLRCNYHFSRGRPLPEDLRNFHIMDTYGDAMDLYRPMPWNGPALLVRSAAREPEPTGWEGVLTDLRTVVVPGDHRSIITAKGVRPIADIINAKLKELRL
jgi:thioesterase domain-containing protein